MAEIQESSGKTGKSKQKKFSVRVDFTPMVDMNMLLITFFMLCTSLSKPQTMEISMPTNDKVTEEEQTKIKASQAVTLLLGADDKVYYYFGEPNYEDYTSLKETDYSPEGLRAMLLDRNKEVTARINASHSATAAPASVRCFRHWRRSPLQHPVLSALLA